MNANQRGMMLHALGGDLKKQWRNYYCMCVGGPDDSEWFDLCAKGFAIEGVCINGGNARYFAVTHAGLEALKQEASE